MNDKASQPDWQRLKLADFGSANAKPSGATPAQQAKSKDANDQTRGFVQGYDDGLVSGRVEGFASGEIAGAAEGQQAARQLLSLAATLDKSLIAVDQEIADEILALALEVARQMTRQAVDFKPDVVMTVVREALSHLPHQHAAIYLHPDDAALVRKHGGELLTHAGHRINEDSALQRGDVVIEANGAQVDATLDTRWRRIVESLGSKNPWIDDERT